MEKNKRTLGFIFTHPLGSKHPVKVLFRFLMLQLQSGISRSKLLVKPFVSRLKDAKATKIMGRLI